MKENYYVRNKNLLPEILKFKKSGIVSEELGKMIMAIAEGYSNRAWWNRYTWREDMVSEACLTCIKYLHNFDVEKSLNPFAYISTIVHNSYRQFVIKEGRHGDIKEVLYDKCHESGRSGNEMYAVCGINYESIVDGLFDGTESTVSA